VDTPSSTDNEVDTPSSTDNEVDTRTDMEGSTGVEDENLSILPKGRLKVIRDKEVAKKENLATETIRRYRKGERSPKDPTFYERWKPTPHRSSWISLS